MPKVERFWHWRQAGIAVYSPHTAFDNTRGGINELLAPTTRADRCATIATERRIARCKVVVFVPDADLAGVSDAMFAAGAGLIGEYRECSFRVAGTGTFFGGELTNPTVGKKGRREEVAEWRLEVVCTESRRRECHSRDAVGPFVRRAGVRCVRSAAHAVVGR